MKATFFSSFLYKFFAALLVVMLTVTALPVTPTYAASCTWTGTTSTAWATATNWSGCGGVAPQPADTVTIPNVANDPVISTNVTIAGLTTTDGILSVSVANTNVTVTVSGNVTNGGTIQVVNAAGNNAHTLNVSGNFTNNGTFTTTATNDVLNVVMNGTSAQSIGGTTATAFNNLTISNTAAAVTAANNFSVTGTMTVNSNTTFNASTFVVSGGGAFTLAAGGTLGVGSTAGISGTCASGNIQTNTCNYSAAANYVYNGTANQNTGTGLPNNLTGTVTINDPGFTVTLNNAKTIASGGTVNIVAGTFAAGTNLTMASTSSITRSGGSMTGTLQGGGIYNVTYTGNSMTTSSELSGAGLNNITVNLTAGQTLTLDQNRAPDGNLSVTSGTFDLSTFTMNRSAGGGTAAVSNGAALKIGGTNGFPANYATHTLGATSTVEYAGTAQTVSVETYGNLNLSGSGLKSISGATSIGANIDISGTAQANIGAGLTIPANSLSFGGTGQASGSWGSTSSAAAHTDNTRFSATTGMLNVATSTSAPVVTNVTSTTANGSYTTGSVISITITFDQVVAVTGTPQLTLETGATDRTVNYVSGSGTNTLTFTYTVQAGDTSADLDYVATTSLALNGGTIKNAGGTNATLTLATPGTAGSLGANKNIVIDTTAPTVTNVTSTTANGSYTTGAVIAVTVTFSENVNVTGTPTLTLNSGGTASYASGSGTNTLTFNYTVAAGQNSADLDYIATNSLALSGGTIRDAALNNATLTLAAPGAAGSLGTNKNIVIDTTIPTVTIDQAGAQADPTNSSPINFTVVFSEAVSGFTAADVTLGGTAGATTAVVTGGPATYTVAVSGMTSDGTVTASINLNAAADAAGNNSAASTSTDNQVAYDATAPTVTIDQAGAQTDPTNASPINFTVVFSEAVSGFTAADITLGGSAGATTAVVTGGPSTYNVAVSGMSSDGTVIASVNVNAAADAVGNNSAASTSIDNQVTYDATAPTVTIDQAGAQADPTNSSPIDFTVVFSEPVSGFVAANITLSSGTAVVTGGPTTYNVAVSGMAQGVLTASLPSGAASDAVGNASAASTSTDNQVLFDTVTPDTTITSNPSNPSNSANASFSFTGSDPSGSGVAGFECNLDGGGFSACSSSQSYLGLIDGSHTFQVRAVDAVGNIDATPASFTWIIDSVNPTVTIDQAGAQADPTNTSPINFTVVFSKSVSGFTAADVTLGGTAGATTAVVTGGPATYNVSVSGMTSDGTVTASVNANAAVDVAGNNSAASTSTDNQATYDATAPTVTIDQAGAQADPTNSSPINFTVVFSEAVSGFTAADVTLGGTAGATTAVVTGGPATYTVAVSGMTSDGTVLASVNANAAADTAGNNSAASTSTDNTVTYIATILTVTIDQAAAQTDPTNASPINFTVVFSAATSDFVTGDVTLSGTAGATAATVTGSGTTYNVAVSGMTSNGTVIATIAANVATDVASNLNSASTSTDNTVTYDSVNPTVASTTLTTNYIGTGPGSFIAIFSKAVDDPAGNTGIHDVTNPANFLLVNKGANGIANTASCAGGVAADDTQVTVTSVVYNSATFQATVTLVGALPVGSYRLFICGTTSIVDLAGNHLNGGADYIFDLVVQAPSQQGGGGNNNGSGGGNNNGTSANLTGLLIPVTGFAHGEITKLSEQPANKAYSATDVWLEIPKLGVKMSIVGVPRTKTGWDISWLGKNAGWLNGSAFPTWSGNSVLTGHVWDALNRPGPFAGLINLTYGDQVKVHAFGQIYVYEIVESQVVLPSNIATAFKHEEKSWLTLITCENYQDKTETYTNRRMVRAVLMSVSKEK